MLYKGEFSCYQHNLLTNTVDNEVRLGKVRPGQASVILAALMSTHFLFSSGSCQGFIASLCNVFVSVALLTSLQNSFYEFVLDVLFYFSCLLHLHFGQDLSPAPFALPLAIVTLNCQPVNGS